MKKVLKKIVICLLVMILVSGGICVSYIIDKKRTFEKQLESIPGIVCIGDSLTAGTEGGYPKFLSDALIYNGVRVPVYNLGVGGENTLTIAGRIGAIPFRVMEFTIPDGKESTEISLLPYDEWQITPLKGQGNDSINPCSIAGVEGELTGENNDGTMTYYFTRSEEGDSVQVEEGTEIETYAHTAYTDCIYIVFIGENVSYDDEYELLSQQQAIIDTQMNDDRFLIIGVTSGTAADRADMETFMENTWGDRYINLREVLSDEETLADAGIIVTEEDRRQMAEGLVPDCVRVDGVHYTVTGYSIVADTVYNRMTELGYLDEVNQLAFDYSKRWGWIQEIKK